MRWPTHEPCPPTSRLKLFPTMSPREASKDGRLRRLSMDGTIPSQRRWCAGHRRPGGSRGAGAPLPPDPDMPLETRGRAVIVLGIESASPQGGGALVGGEGGIAECVLYVEANSGERRMPAR